MEKSVKFYRTTGKAEDIIKAMLNFNDGGNYIEEWQFFRDLLITEKSMNAFWMDDDFKRGVFLVCNITDTMIETNFNYGHKESERENARQADSLVARLIGSCYLGNDGSNKSIIKLIEALEVLPISNSDDLNDLKIELNTIARCQQMVLEMVIEEGDW